MGMRIPSVRPTTPINLSVEWRPLQVHRPSCSIITRNCKENVDLDNSNWLATFLTTAPDPKWYRVAHKSLMNLIGSADRPPVYTWLFNKFQYRLRRNHDIIIFGKTLCQNSFQEAVGIHSQTPIVGTRYLKFGKHHWNLNVQCIQFLGKYPPFNLKGPLVLECNNNNKKKHYFNLKKKKKQCFCDFSMLKYFQKLKKQHGVHPSPRHQK
jgi:hypothetical protein